MLARLALSQRVCRRVRTWHETDSKSKDDDGTKEDAMSKDVMKKDDGSGMMKKYDGMMKKDSK